MHSYIANEFCMGMFMHGVLLIGLGLSNCVNFNFIIIFLYLSTFFIVSRGYNYRPEEL